jgi:hypothetical protein
MRLRRYSLQIPGILGIDDNKKESRLDGTLLAVEGSASPLGDATQFLENKGFSDGQRVEITGDRGKLGKTSVIFMVDAMGSSAVSAPVNN